MIGLSRSPLRRCRVVALGIYLLVAALAGSCAPATTPAPAAPPTPAPAPATNTPPPSPVSAAASPSPSPSPATGPAASPAASPSPGPSPSPAALAPPPARKLNVVATTTQVQDFVRNVGGDRINLIPILPPGADPHDYQPTADDARKFVQADVVFYNGVGLEPWIEDMLENVRGQTPAIGLAQAAGIAIRDGETHEQEEEHEHEKEEEGTEHAHSEGDPHAWYDPTNAQKMVNAIRETLARAEAPGAPVYQANATGYNRQLDALDAQIKQQVATIPQNQRKLVTNHESFGYYAERYGLELVGTVIPSLSTEAQPSAAELQELVRAIRAENVKAIFTERNLNTRLEQQVAQQAGVKVVSSLYGDTLGPPGSEGDTYIKAMLHDTRVIVENLR